MITTEAVEKQRIEATQQLTSVSTAQEKMLKDQLDMQLQMLEAETARQIELTQQTSGTDARDLVLCDGIGSSKGRKHSVVQKILNMAMSLIA